MKTSSQYLKEKIAKLEKENNILKRKYEISKSHRHEIQQCANSLETELARKVMELKSYELKYQGLINSHKEYEEEVKTKTSELEKQIASIEDENNRLYQQACKAEEELLKFKAEPSKVHGSYERIVICDDPKPVDPYQVFKDAIKEGKTVQYKNAYGEWEDPSPKHTFQWSWCNEANHYRIKPEPVYVPFTFEDAEQLIGKAVKEKTNGIFGIVTWVLHDCVEIGADPIAFSALFEFYTFLDGTPCGKLAE